MTIITNYEVDRRPIYICTYTYIYIYIRINIHQTVSSNMHKCCRRRAHRKCQKTPRIVSDDPSRGTSVNRVDNEPANRPYWNNGVKKTKRRRQTNWCI